MPTTKIICSCGKFILETDVSSHMLGLSLPMKEKENRNYSDFFINCLVITNLLRVIISASQNTLQVKYEEN